MLIDKQRWLETNIPKKAPVGDCEGWLYHNSRLCDCYTAEREALERDYRKPSPLFMDSTGWMAGFVTSAALAIAVATSFYG